MSIKGTRFIVWMYFKRLIRECLKAIWAFLNKKRGTLKEKDLKQKADKFLKDYKKKKAILMIVFLFIDGWIWNGLIDDLREIDFNDKIVYERVGAVVSSPLVTGEETVTLDTQDSENGEGEANLVSTSPAIEKKATVTAYNSVPEQTDGDPCISADMTNICEFDGCVVAQNGVPFGTKVEIEGFGICEVHDRKHSRYDSNWIDVYFGGRDKIETALDFGIRELNYKFLES